MSIALNGIMLIQTKGVHMFVASQNIKYNNVLICKEEVYAISVRT